MVFVNKRIALLLMVLILLTCSGCIQPESAETPEKPTPIGSEVWETMPQLTYGVMEYEKLQILPWNSGRCEATSFNRMAETKNGFYMPLNISVLHYADKTDLSLWLPVCSKPDCQHGDTGCDAYMASTDFVIKNNRIYYQQLGSALPELYSDSTDYFLVSMAEDGGDKRFEFAFNEYIPSTPTHSIVLLTSQGWYYNMVEMDAYGAYTAHAYRVTESGWEEYAKVNNWGGSSSQLQSTLPFINLWGDRMFTNTILNPSQQVFYRDNGDELEMVDTNDLPVKYAYLSGDTLRFFRINDGYYDRNIKTGEEIKLADAQLENSFANIVLPNCILESTLMTYLLEGNAKNLPEGTVHAMRLFDGKVWRDVLLPENLRNANSTTFLKVVCITSDSIIFSSKDMADYMNRTKNTYYILDLTAEELAIEYLMTSR